MPPFLTGLAAKLIGLAVIAVVIAGLIAYINIVQGKLDTEIATEAITKGELATQVQVNTDNLITLGEIRARSAAEIKAVVADRDRVAAQVKVLATHREKLAHAPASADALLGPDMLDLLAGLRADASAPAAGQDPGGKAGDPSRPVGAITGAGDPANLDRARAGLPAP